MKRLRELVATGLLVGGALSLGAVQYVPETADFLTGEGTAGWTRGESHWQSPEYSNSIVRVQVTCSNLTDAAAVRIVGLPNNAFRVEADANVALERFVAEWLDTRVPKPQDFWVTNVTATSFLATCSPVAGAAGYELLLYTNALVGACAGVADWRETFDRMGTSSGTSAMTADKMSLADNPDWTWRDGVYLAPPEYQGQVRLGSTRTNGVIRTPPFSARGAGHLRVTAQCYGADAGQTLAVCRKLRSDSGEGEELLLQVIDLALAPVTAHVPFPELAEGEGFVLRSCPKSGGEDARVLVDDVAVVSGYVEGEVRRVCARSEVRAEPRFEWNDVDCVLSYLAVRARGARRADDSEETDAVEVDFANPPKMPMLCAQPLSACLAEGFYVAPFGNLPQAKSGRDWLNGVEPLPYWSAYRGEVGVTKIGYGNGSSGTGTYNLFFFNSTNAVDNPGPALGSMVSGTAGMRYGVSFVNDTTQDLVDFRVTYRAVQWNFKNADSSKTITAEYLVTNGLADVSADGDWVAMPALDFATPYPAAVAEADDCWQEEKSAALGNVRLRPGECLVMRWVDAKKANSPGTGIAGFRLDFGVRSAATIMILR